MSVFIFRIVHVIDTSRVGLIVKFLNSTTYYMLIISTVPLLQKIRLLFFIIYNSCNRDFLNYIENIIIIIIFN